jgi:hypothetical protein
MALFAQANWGESQKMMFLFAYLGEHCGFSAGEMIRLIHGTEAVFIIVALACISLAVCSRFFGIRVNRGAVAVIGGISGSFGALMPLELAPYFFNVPEGIMLGTLVLNLVYPIMAIIFASLFKEFMNPRRG